MKSIDEKSLPSEILRKKTKRSQVCLMKNLPTLTEDGRGKSKTGEVGW